MSAPPTLQDRLVPGFTLAGRYRVERVLGRGGMGMVVAAENLFLGQRVALKVVLPEVLGNAEAVRRFVQEAKAAASIPGEHVARVLDAGVFDSGEPFMVMEYLDGTDLGAVLETQGAQPIYLVVEWALQACQALAAAHALGIVHRDVKPPNLFLTTRADGSQLIKVLDFGISKRAGSNMTLHGAKMGTPGYMSPEQLRSTRDVDARSDVWALGVVLYELATGRRPFLAAALPRMPEMLIFDPSVSGFERVVARCLELRPEDRFQNVAELARALAPYASDPTSAARAAASISRTLGIV